MVYLVVTHCSILWQREFYFFDFNTAKRYSEKMNDSENNIISSVILWKDEE